MSLGLIELSKRHTSGSKHADNFKMLDFLL